METVSLKWYRDILGAKLEYDQEIAIHPHKNGKILLNYPGADGHLDGYNNKYITLANHIVDSNLAAVMRCSNPYTGGWDRSMREMLNYALDNAEEICGSKSPEIYLMGFSAGAGAISTLAWEYPEVTKILLMAPAIGVGERLVREGLKQFKGEVYIMIGDSDDVVKTESGEVFLNFCDIASRKELFVLENCDHQFTGERNGRIMSHAPFYAFLDEKPVFPDYEAGIFLYD